VLQEKESSSLWRRLRRLLSLLAQIVFLIALLFAAADPKLGTASPSARSVVVIVDASASMKALDSGPQAPTRMDLAKQKARDLLRSLGGADSAMIVRMDGQTTALSRFETDVPRLLEVIDKLEASDTPADLPRALQAAADALRGRKNPLVVIIGDGAYREEDRDAVIWETPKLASADAKAPLPAALGKIDLSGIAVAFVPVGKPARNVGLVAFNVRRYFQNKMSYEVLVEVQNFAKEPARVKFTLASGADVVDVKLLDLAPGEKLRKIYPDLAGGDDRQLTARIAPAPIKEGDKVTADAFPLDDVAYALLPERRKQKVLLVSNDNLYLEGALLLDPNIVVDKLKPDEYEAELAKGTVHGHDVVVFDGFTPEKAPPAAGAIYFKPSGAGSPVPVSAKALARPRITDVAPDHPVTRWVTLSDLNMDASNVLVPAESDTVLARSIRDPLVVAGKKDGKKYVVFGFGLDGTDLMLRVAFPVLIINSLDWFAGDDAELITTYRTGHEWRIPVDAETDGATVNVKDPKSGRVAAAPVLDGRATFYGRHVGVYDVETGDRTLAVAANLADPFESSIATADKLVLSGKEIADAPEFAVSMTRSIWVWILLGALALSLVEWLTYNRRITV
jgi:Ca-activated chloride channel homolog